MTDLGTFLKGRRIREGWNQAEAATATTVSLSRLRELEAGESFKTKRNTQPSRDILQKLALGYGVPENFLLRLAGEEVPDVTVTDEEVKLFDYYQNLDSDRRRILWALLEALQPRQ